jgi:hypothetical protein
LANSAPIFGNTFVSEAAASTVRGLLPEEPEVPEAPGEPDELDEQAVSRSIVAAATAATMRRPLNRRPRCRLG